MHTSLRSTRLSGLWVLLALAAALFLFSPAMAQGEQPPPEAPSAPEGLTPAVSPGAPEGGEGAAEAPGEAPAQPLQTGELELYLSSGADADPWYTWGGTTYRFLRLGGNCALFPGDICMVSLGDDPINDALDDMDINNRLPSDRYLHIEQGIYISSDEVDINGASSPIWAQLKGIIGAVEPDTYEPLVDIQDAFIITNIPGGFYLKGLNVISADLTSGAVQFSANGGTVKLEDVWVQNTNAAGDYGLAINNHNGSVEFNRVKVNGNPENGARIETTTASGSIKITSSSFDDNGGAPGVKMYNGLQIISNQVVTLNGFSASGNTGTGLNILRRLDGNEALTRNLTIKNATVNNNVSGDSAYGYGVRLGAVTGPDFLYPAGSLILENATAIGNDEYGFMLYNKGDVTIKNILTLNNTDQGTYVNNLDGGKVTVSQVRHEGVFALYVVTTGAVSVTDLHADGGRLYVDNSTGSGNITLTDVSVTDSTTTGITLYSDGTVVTLKDVQSNSNGSYGISIQTNGSGGVSILGGSGIQNEASGNDGNGLYIVTNGAIKIANMVTNGNGNPGAAYGMVLVNDIFGEARNVTLTDVQASNNYQDGIYLTSLGTIRLNGVIANNNGNGGDGIEIPNSTSLKNVTIQPTKATPQNQFDNNAGTGAVIVTQGAVTIKQVSASGNYSGGVLINIAAVGKAVSIDGGVFDGNELFGLDIFTAGKITLKDISASNNGVPNDAYGAVISNQNASNNNPVSISNGQFSYNEGSGLVVRSFGAVTLSNITAISNDFEVDTQGYRGIGIDVDNSFGKGGVTISATKPQDIYLYQGAFLNQGDGVRVKTTGAIVIMNISSSNNGVIGGSDEFGFYLNNALGINTGILLTNLVADNNRGDGVKAISTGAISVNGLQASDNDGAGMSGQTISPGKAQKISVSNSETNSNSDTGMLLVNEGAVLLTNIISNLNDFLGVVVYNNGPTFISPVTLKSSGGKTNQINGNTFVGLFIESNGAITMSNTEVNGNYGPRAAYLDNDYQLKAQKVTVSNSTFNDNFDPGASTTIGLEILSLGNISLSGVSASGNESFGVSSNNDTSADHKGTFTVSKSSFDNNGNDGLFAETHGKITLKDVSASGNAVFGLDLDNGSSSSAATISITNLVINDNQSGGANLDSAGSVSITNATVHENNGDGLDIEANNGSGKVTLKSIFVNFNNGKGIDILAANTVSITNAYVLGSGSDGFEVNADGFAVRITNSSAVGNGGYGIEIDNDQLAPINLTGTVFGGNVSGDLYWD